MRHRFDVIETIKVWECVGCGRIDHPQPCVGICQDRKAEYVRAEDYRKLETLLRDWVDDNEAAPGDLDAIAIPDERNWQDGRRELLIY